MEEIEIKRITMTGNMSVSDNLIGGKVVDKPTLINLCRANIILLSRPRHRVLGLLQIMSSVGTLPDNAEVVLLKKDLNNTGGKRKKFGEA